MTDTELLRQVATDVAMMKQAIMGNGVKGLNDRMGHVEAWVEEHPRTCPLGEHISDTVDSLKERRVSGWAVFAAVVGAIGVAGSLAVALMK
jgi:hypothetical protein